ncbi:MAG: YdiU family protein [Cucumibacter sp.]
MASPRPSTKHSELGLAFYDLVEPAKFPKHILRYRNRRWAGRVGLGKLSAKQWIAHFGKFEPLPGSFQTPLALRYHGHQFRAYNPEIGDGRGFLFAQLHDLEDGRLLDLGTKGSGKTPFSRTADGRLTLKGGVREVLATEMLEAMGVDTSKTFSLIETGEALSRGDEPSPTRASVLVRLNHSHIRIGTFERFAFFRDTENLRRLLNYSIATYLPAEAGADDAASALNFLRMVCQNVARVGAQWVAAGFVHGVLNSDNINITGESFDYGPWRFLPAFDPNFTAAYFDETGLYSFGRQAEALAWNLTRLAECLLPFAEAEALNEALATFAEAYRREVPLALLARLGLKPQGVEEDSALVTLLFDFLADTKAPYEQVLFDWRGGQLSDKRAARSPIAALYESASFAPVRLGLSDRKPVARNLLAHRYFARLKPRTMLIEEMEALWSPVAESDDWAPFNAALGEIREMALAYGNWIGEK